MTADLADRALGALTGLALGDALGMPTQMLSRSQVRERWGQIRGFEPGPDDNPISRGMPAATITDDTEQALIVADLLIEGGGHLDPARLADRLLDWHTRMVARGSLDLLGPSTMRALEAVRQGKPVTESGRWGDTNGAAMRVAPVGIICPATDLAQLADLVAEVDLLTHNTIVANAGACAVAAAVSAGLDGLDVRAALETGLAGARVGATRGEFVPGPDVARRIEGALDLVSSGDDDLTLLELIDALIGTSVATQESVPAAFAIAARFASEPWGGVCAAASLGGDSDTVAAMAGAMLGACHGAGAFPAEAVRALRAANPHLRLDDVASALLALRRSSPGSMY